MANINEVNYEEIPGKANEMQQEGVQLNAELSAAWNRVNDLRSTWHGLRYNTLISYFNNITDEVNELLDLVICKIPETLGIVAKNYASVEGTSVAAVGAGSVTMIETLSESDTSTMAYNSGNASDVQSTVSSNFSNAENYMNSIESIFSSINWESDASETFRQKFKSLKSQIIDALTNINTQFTNLMQAAQTDIESAESANTIN